MDDFHQRTVLITGAAGGFGALLAETLAERGANLVLGDVREEALAALAEKLGSAARALRCDVTSEEDLKALCQLAIETYGSLDIAVNNAGATPPMKGFLETSEADLDWAYQINAKSVFFGMKQQIPIMLEQGQGSILNVASLAGLGAAPKLAAYGAAKHAVIGLTKTAAVEFARKGLRINALCPFYSPTPLMTESNLIERKEQLESASPMKRLAAPEEVVAAMISIIAPNNSFMTGQAIAVDGGVSAL